MAKTVGFVFQFPPIQGVFDTGNGMVYIFGELHEDEIEDIITHEILHYVVRRLRAKEPASNWTESTTKQELIESTVDCPIFRVEQRAELRVSPIAAFEFQ